MPKPIPRLPPVIKATRLELEDIEAIDSQLVGQRSCGRARFLPAVRHTKRLLLYDSRPTCLILRKAPCDRTEHNPSRWGDGIRSGAGGPRDPPFRTNRVRRAKCGRSLALLQHSEPPCLS